MNMLTSERLADLTIKALERTAFVLADMVDPNEAASLPTPGRFAQITYSGPTDGLVVLSASDGFLAELASSLLGVDPGEIDLNVQGNDAIKELANIVGGSVILELGGTDCMYSIGLPELIAAAPRLQASQPGARCTLDSSGEALWVNWLPGVKIPAVAA
jgi:hypothetical protein